MEKQHPPTIQDAVSLAKQQQDDLINRGPEKPGLGSRFMTGLISGAMAGLTWTGIAFVWNAIAERKSGLPLLKRTDWKEVGNELAIVVPAFGIMSGAYAPDIQSHRKHTRDVQASHAQTKQLETLEGAVATAIADPNALKVLTDGATVQTLANKAEEKTLV